MQFSEEMNEIIVHTLCGLKLNDTLQQTEQSHIAIHIELHVEALHIHHTMVQFQSIRRFCHSMFALGVRFAMIRDQFRFEFSWYLIVSIPHTQFQSESMIFTWMPRQGNYFKVE